MFANLVVCFCFCSCFVLAWPLNEHSSQAFALVRRYYMWLHRALKLSVLEAAGYGKLVHSLIVRGKRVLVVINGS